LVHGLPPEAAIWWVDGQQWTVRDELLAQAVERIDGWGRMNALLHGDKKLRKALPKKPLEVPRPGALAKGKPERRQRRRVTTDSDEADAFFASTPKF
jgi:hypothetical protein